MATIPFLYDLSDRTGWFTHTQLADMIAISESTPGPIGVNMATHVGYEMSGVLGSISTTLGFVAPSIIIIVIVSIFLQKFRDNRYVESAFTVCGRLPPADCLGSAFGGHCGAAGRWLELWYPVAEHPLAGGGAGGIFGHCDQPKSRPKKWHPIVFLGFSAVVGIVFHFAGGVKRRLPKVFCRVAGRKMWLLYCI